MPQAIWIFQRADNRKVTSGKELLEKVELTEDNASKLQQEFSKEWQDANDKWNAMWASK